MKVEVNKELCIGCGACQAIANYVFEIGDDGQAFAKDVVITEEMEEEVLDAVEGCPVSAITKVEE